MIVDLNTTVVFLFVLLWAVVTQRNLFLWGVIVYNVPYYALFFPVYDVLTTLLKYITTRSSAMKDGQLWFYMDKKANEFGPVKLLRIKELIKNNKISKHTYVRNVNSPNWVTATDVLQ